MFRIAQNFVLLSVLTLRRKTIKILISITNLNNPIIESKSKR